MPVDAKLIILGSLFVNTEVVLNGIIEVEGIVVNEELITIADGAQLIINI